MKFKVESSFDFPDHKEWYLLVGDRIEGQIQYMGKDHELVIDKQYTIGFYVQRMYWNEEVQDEFLQSIHNLDIPFKTFDEALNAAEKWTGEDTL